MKYAYVLAVLLPAALLAGCNQPNNGELPPAGELPTPFPKPATTADAGGATPASQSSPSGSNAAAAATPATATASGGYQYDASAGKQVYANTCSVCHQPTGVGIPGAFPPLKGNPVVLNPDATQQILTVLNGAHGAKTIKGVKYNGVMPPFGGNLNNTQIANLINYERSSWGNHAKHTTPAKVAKVRKGAK